MTFFYTASSLAQGMRGRELLPFGGKTVDEGVFPPPPQAVYRFIRHCFHKKRKMNAARSFAEGKLVESGMIEVDRKRTISHIGPTNID